MLFIAVALLVPGAFLLGRTTNPNAASPGSQRQTYTLQQGDVSALRAQQLTAPQALREARRLLCHRSPAG
jgi:hypothetical protein